MSRKKVSAAILIIVLVASMSACRKRQASAATGDLHPITVRVHPDGALVRLEQPQQKLIAVIEQHGPVAAFRLPVGRYGYEVMAPGFNAYQGRFTIPKNQHLEVWLTAK